LAESKESIVPTLTPNLILRLVMTLKYSHFFLSKYKIKKQTYITIYIFT